MSWRPACGLQSQELAALLQALPKEESLLQATGGTAQNPGFVPPEKPLNPAHQAESSGAGRPGIMKEKGRKKRRK